MSQMRKLAVTVMLIAMACCGNSLLAQELNKTFSHSLAVGSSAQSYEHRIDLPEQWAAQGRYFIGRTLRLDGKLVVEREELTRTSYYVKVRLPKATLWFAKGSIDISLKAGAIIPGSPTLPAPANLRVYGELYPKFSWAGTGNYSAISLLERASGKTLWERVILDDQACSMDEGSVKVGGKYTWAVKQADESARYSLEARADFRVGTKQVKCNHCYGKGYNTCRSCNGSGHTVSMGPDNKPVYKICYTCNGSGRERCSFCHGNGHQTVADIIPE